MWTLQMENISPIPTVTSTAFEYPAPDLFLPTTIIVGVGIAVGLVFLVKGRKS